MLGMRIMYDCIHDNVYAVKGVVKPGDLVALYDTGSPDIRETAADLVKFTGHQVILIDQGFTGSPQPMANVRDVEPGAWIAAEAVRNRPWSPSGGRPTIYCDRNDLAYVKAAGWTGDVWLAAPGPMPTSRVIDPQVNIVAVQFGFNQDGGRYDVSVVFDGNWPFRATAPEGLSVTGHNGYANFGWSVEQEATKYELVSRGAGGAGTGTSYVDTFYSGNHAHISMGPGKYMARVRPFFGNHLTGAWSGWHLFTVARA